MILVNCRIQGKSCEAREGPPVYNQRSYCEFPEYLLLNPDPLKVNHYIDINRKELVFIPDTSGHLPSLRGPTYGWISDNNGSLYRPATQMEVENIIK